MAAVGAAVPLALPAFEATTSRAPLSARRHYPRSRTGEAGAQLLRSARPSSSSRSRPGSGSGRQGDENFNKFLQRTAPGQDELKEHVFDKNPAEAYLHEAQYIATRISLSPPEAKLDLAFKDTRNRPLPAALRPQTLDVLERSLRCTERGGKAPTGHPADQFYDEAAARAPPQPIPAATQKLESEFLETIEQSVRDGQVVAAMWDQYAKRAEELIITMSLDKVLRVLKAFVMARYRGPDLYTLAGSELAKEVRSASSTRLCQVLHWLSRAGLRDQTLMTLTGNEILLRLHDDFVLDMYIEVLNVHAKLDIRNPRLISAVLRELTPHFSDLSREQVSAIAPLTTMNVLSEQSRIAYLSRCADLGLGLPVRMTRPAVLRQFRLLEDCLRLDYHPTTLPNVVQMWLANLKQEADVQDVIEPAPLTPVEEDMLRILREDMDVAVTPTLQDGILTLHLVMGKAVLEVLDPYADYYVTPAMGGQRLLRADTKLRHRLLWRRGWRVLTLDEDMWTRLKDDIYKKDLLEAILLGHQNPGARRQFPIA